MYGGLAYYNGQPGVYIRNAKFALLRKLRKRSEFASLRFASLRRKLKSVRFAFASLFEGPNSPKSENFRRILAFFLTKTASKEAQNQSSSLKIFMVFKISIRFAAFSLAYIKSVNY